MTPKEQAEELVNGFKKLRNYSSYAYPLCHSTAKQCALLAIKFIEEIGIPIYNQEDADKFYNDLDELKREVEIL